MSAFVLLTAAAQATPPTLVSVGGTGGRVTASWTLPSGMAMDFIEAAPTSVVAQMAEPGTITATGTVRAPNASKVYRFKTALANVSPGLRVKLRLRLPKKALKVVKKALKRGKKLKAKVTVTAKDSAGNTHSAKGTIKLKL